MTTRKPKDLGIMLPMGVPLIIAKDDGDMKAVAEAGLPLTYVLGSKPGKKKDDPSVATVFKCVRNLVGYSITEVEDDGLDLLEITEHCWYGLPPIPRTIVRDLNAFFRMVDEKLGTEAIVLLTFDPAKLAEENPSEGWGVLVPKQSNSAGSCHYDPASVAEEKPDGHLIAGSVHSHPGMSAFASHTDIKDQADFDGIHITYGWKGKSKVTEYHVELQSAGGRFNYTPDQAFEAEEEEEHGEQVVDWLGKVAKEKPYQQYGGNHNNHTPAAPVSLRLPKEIPMSANPRSAGIIIEMMVGEASCPGCKFRLTEFDKKRRRCSDCMCFLSLPLETVEDVIGVRWDNEKLSSPELDERATKGVWFWKRWKEKNQHGVEIFKERVDVEREPKAIEVGGSGKG